MRTSLHVALLALWGGSSRALTVVPLAPASARWSIATAPPRAAEARCKLGFKPKELVVGEKAEGIVSKITDYGCFVSLCGGQQLGLLHIRQLADGKRMLKNEVEDFVEEVPHAAKNRMNRPSCFTLAFAAPPSALTAESLVARADGRPRRVEGECRGAAARVQGLEADLAQLD